MKRTIVTKVIFSSASFSFLRIKDPVENFFFCTRSSKIIDKFIFLSATDATSLIMEEVSKYDEFIKFSNDFLTRSYEYFFLAAQFGTYAKDRPGFKKLLHGLSDSAWNKGIEMIKESAKRGIPHRYALDSETEAIMSSGNVTELVAIAKAAAIEKKLLIKANNIHRHHSHASLDVTHSCGYDAGLAHYIAEEIMEEKTETVRKLTGYANQLKKLFVQDSKVYPLSLFLFDQHLQ
jgi:hypothetical protein